MNPPSILLFINTIFQGVLLIVICAFSVPCYANKVFSTKNQTVAASPFLKYENGLIEAKINKIALDKVFQELVLKTNIQINLYSSSISNQLISVVIKEASLVEAIGIILQDFSYALYSVDRGLILSVLSSSGVSLASMNLPETPSHTGMTYDGTMQGNEEFTSLVTENVRSDIDADIEMNSDPNSSSESEQDYIEALLKHAGNASIEQIDEEMLDELVNIDDPRATEFLIDTSTSKMDTVSSIAAINIIWRHAKNLENFNTVALDALQQLAQDRDDNVRTIARQALYDVQKENTDEF